ncbi:MAG: dTMP kinase [Alphaproteobacteria bacterium]|nr:dTMP kinase [Alphaproteobacteria bacterium]
MRNEKGLFITFEGGEGTGKSTQLRLLAEVLQKAGIANIATKEPGGTDVGQELRRILVTGDKDKCDAVAEALLYYADRRIHLTNKIWPALENGTWVLSDRFADSTVAYQYYGYNKRISMEMLDDLYKMVVGDFKPDLTIILDIDPQIGLARSMAKSRTMAVKETRHESRGLEFHNNLRAGYLELAAREPQRFAVLNADKSIDELHEDIKKLVSERFKVNLCQK